VIELNESFLYTVQPHDTAVCPSL